MQLKTADGTPVRGATISWTTATGSLVPATSKTDATGTAKTSWLLGTASGTQTGTAQVVGGSQSVTFTASVGAGMAEQIALVSGDGQTAAAGTPVADSLAVRVLDHYGNPVPGVAVAWTALRGGGSLAPSPTTTGANGVAKARWTLGPRLDSAQLARATAGAAGSVDFTATATLPTNLTIEKTAGDNQTATVTDTLPVPITVTVKLADGRPLPGAPVTFAIVHDSTDNSRVLAGRVFGQPEVTDSLGRISARWMLGTYAEAGKQAKAQLGTGGAAVVFTATGVAKPFHDAVNLGPIGLTAPVGTVLADSLTLLARDLYGNPVPNQQVHWVVQSGGGSVSPDSAPTRADGTARTQWTLGGNAGTQQVNAIAAGKLAATYTVTATGPISISITTPAGNAIVGDSLGVAATVSAPRPIVSVSAAVSGRTAALTAGGSGGWTGSLSLAGLPYDTLILAVTATDDQGHTATEYRQFRHHDLDTTPPTITIAQPPQNSVALDGQVRVVATCSDNRACYSLSLYVFPPDLPDPPQPVAQGTNSVDATVTANAGGVWLRAYDTSNNQTVVFDTVFSVPSAHLAKLDSTTGRVLDASADRLLHREPSGGSVVLRTTDRASRTETTIFSDPARVPVEAYLAPGVALFSTTTTAGLQPHVHEWRGGSATDLGTLTIGSPLKVRGGWGAWSSGGQLVLRDLSVGSSQLLGSGITPQQIDVAANGDAVWQQSNQVWLYHGGASTMLAGDATHDYSNPATDGTNVVYLRGVHPGAGARQYDVVLHRAAGDTVLAGDTLLALKFSVGNGYVLYNVRNASGWFDVWLRSPAGGLSKVGSYPGQAQGEIGPAGDVLFKVQDSSGATYTYLYSGGAAATVSEPFYRFYFLGSTPVELIGNSLLQVTP